MLFRFLLTLTLCFSVVTFVGCEKADDSAAEQNADGDTDGDTDGDDEGGDEAKDIVQTAIDADGFDTLVAAVKAADLVETLQGEGPFTVFAPTDEAFAALPEGTLDDLLKPENKDKLTAILTYHVVPAKVMAADVKPGDVDTVQGGKLTVKVDGETVMVNEAKVVATDVEASNGVIHVIDKVLLPAE